MTGTPADVAVETRPGRSRRAWIWQITRIVVGVLLAVIAIDVVAGRREELQGATSLLENLRWQWVALGMAAEVASLVAFAGIERRMLRAGGVDVGLGSLTGIALAGNAIQNSLPGGVAWASVFAFRQFRMRGADDVLAAWTMVAVEILSAMALAALAAAGVLLSGDDAAALDLAGTIAVLLLVAIVVAVVVRRRQAHVPVTVATWAVRMSQRFLHRPHGDPDEIAQRGWQRLTTVTPGRRDWMTGLLWAEANWVADCACLAMAFLAVGSGVPWAGLLLAYGAGQLAANLPITPGGLGVVEGSLAIALVAYGENQVSAVAAVFLYRLLSFWVMLVIGWTAWAVLVVNARRRQERSTVEAVA